MTERDITNTLDALGIPCNIRAYSYIITAIQLLHENRFKYIRNIHPMLYPEIATIHNTSYASVKRALERAAITVSEKDTALFHEIWKYGIPSSSEFLIQLLYYLGNN